MSSTDPDARPEHRAVRTRFTEPRPAYVIVTIDAPSRLRRDQSRLVHTVRVEDYDPEHQTPLSYALTALSDNPEIRDALADVADDEHRGQDWHVEVASDGYAVYAGPGWCAADEVEHAALNEFRATVNP